MILDMILKTIIILRFFFKCLEDVNKKIILIY